MADHKAMMRVDYVRRTRPTNLTRRELSRFYSDWSLGRERRRNSLGSSCLCNLPVALAHGIVVGPFEPALSRPLQKPLQCQQQWANHLRVDPL